LPATIGLVIALLLASTVAAIALHVWFEKPVIAGLRRRLLRPVGAAADLDPSPRIKALVPPPTGSLPPTAIPSFESAPSEVD
jgi:peptidoglycan/LPS O-acetylase OafA/YrhL